MLLSRRYPSLAGCRRQIHWVSALSCTSWRRCVGQNRKALTHSGDRTGKISKHLVLSINCHSQNSGLPQVPPLPPPPPPRILLLLPLPPPTNATTADATTKLKTARPWHSQSHTHTHNCYALLHLLHFSQILWPSPGSRAQKRMTTASAEVNSIKDSKVAPLRPRVSLHGLGCIEISSCQLPRWPRVLCTSNFSGFFR